MVIKVKQNQDGDVEYECDSVQDALNLGSSMKSRLVESVLVDNVESPLAEPEPEPEHDEANPLLPSPDKKVVSSGKGIGRPKRIKGRNINIRSATLDEIKKVASEIEGKKPSDFYAKIPETSEKSISKYIRAVHFFFMYRVSKKYALTRELRRKTGASDYNVFKIILYKLYPKYAERLLADRDNIRLTTARPHLDPVTKRATKAKKRKKDKKTDFAHSHKAVRPDDKRRDWMRYYQKRLKELGTDRKDKQAVMNISKEWKIMKGSSSSPSSSSSSSVHPSSPVKSTQKEQTPSPISSKFPVIYPMKEDSIQAIKEQVIQCLKDRTPLTYEKVSTFDTIYNKALRPNQFSRFAENFIMVAPSISNNLGIRDKFYLNRVNGYVDIRYKGVTKDE